MSVSRFHRFLRCESGAITVDWVVLTAATAGMALAATAVIEDGIATLASNLDAELRSQQISDAFVVFQSSHFDALYDAGTITEDAAEALFMVANEMTNAEILSGLEDGLLAYNDGTLTDAEVARLVAMASVGVQRNIIAPEDVNLVSTY
ncbi:MAG: hypothetical protein COW55_13605 [Rhodobacteraceae bacterium CG17_big_fil_post_rev_8_21_14_2_50_65_11]|nr:MAG: hypothetical protein COW55_13605 [Rhodobacteraceae bacterium CG17_big_fil_post_rev_8_21_14_2_50_65_11]